MMNRICFLLLFLLLSTGAVNAQFQERTINIGNIGVHITNAGTIGRPNVRNDPQGPPSMEYPLNSGVEHLFEAGLWIGCISNGQVTVSTGAVDDASGYAVGKSGFEFSPLPGTNILTRSSLQGSEFFSTSAVSHQDYIVPFTDEFTIVPGSNQPINNHLTPLNARVRLETYAWNFPFADYFTIFHYRITNNSTQPWDSVYLGIWSDLVVRNVNVTNDRGSAFFNKGSLGYDDTLSALYAYDVAGDRPFTNSYGALQFLGVIQGNQFLHPANPFSPGFKLNPNYWVYNVAAPANDLQRYDRMKNRGDFSPAANLNTPGNRVQLISAGPLHQIEPGETVELVFAAVCAPQKDDQPLDTWFARTDLRKHLDWARRTFNGEDRNMNGILDPNEDANGNGLLDRYTLPEPPPPPKVRIESGNNEVTLYWNGGSENTTDPITQEQDFEGYRLYRTAPGDDQLSNVASRATLLSQWDKPGNNVGYNNGFDAIRLNNPVFFPGDTTRYQYSYKLNDVLNGWQYVYILTAFDRGNTNIGLEPLESSRTANAFRVFSGTPAHEGGSKNVGVYPNPYRASAAWDGNTSRSRKIYFYNLPEEAEISVYTVGGDVVARLFHRAQSGFNGSTAGWYSVFGLNPDQSILPGGEHAWDVLSDSKQTLSSGLYLYSVMNMKTREVQTGKLVIIR